MELKVKPITVLHCIPNGPCIQDPCQLSGTDVCCHDCGDEKHQEEIVNNYIQKAKELNKPIAELLVEAQSQIDMVKKDKKCQLICPICSDGSGLRIRKVKET